MKIAGSASAADTLALHDRQDVLDFEALRISAERAMRQAGVTLEQIGFFEYHDVYSIYAALALESVGFAARAGLEAGGGRRTATRRQASRARRWVA